MQYLNTATEIKKLAQNGRFIFGAKVVGINNVDGVIKSVVYEQDGRQVEIEGDIFISLKCKYNASNSSINIINRTIIRA